MRVSALRDRLVARLQEQVPDAHLNGDPDTGSTTGCPATRT